MELSSAAKKCMERSIKNAPFGVADRTGRRNKS
nr:MAG TPA: cAMP-dependent protein kinase inhibitor [Caudoviricetes sp.]